MLKIYFVSVLLLLSSFGLKAQEKEEYKYAFQFQIGPNFTLRSFQGETFSGKYNFDKNNTLRVGISFVNYNNEVSGLNNGNSSFTTGISHSSNDLIIINLQYLRNNNWNDFKLYFGGGPNISYNFNKNNQEVGNSSANSTTKSTGYGIKVLTGVEWFFNDRMSLSAEYGMNFRYDRTIQYINSNSPNYQANEEKTTSFEISPNQVLFGISIYF